MLTFNICDKKFKKLVRTILAPNFSALTVKSPQLWRSWSLSLLLVPGACPTVELLSRTTSKESATRTKSGKILQENSQKFSISPRHSQNLQKSQMTVSTPKNKCHAFLDVYIFVLTKPPACLGNILIKNCYLGIKMIVKSERIHEKPGFDHFTIKPYTRKHTKIG